MSTADLIVASVVFGPSALLGGALGVGILTGLPRRRYLRGLLNECRAMNADEYGNPTGGPGQPIANPNDPPAQFAQTPGLGQADAGQGLARVIPFPDRSAA